MKNVPLTIANSKFIFVRIRCCSGYRGHQFFGWVTQDQFIFHSSSRGAFLIALTFTVLRITTEHAAQQGYGLCDKNHAAKDDIYITDTILQEWHWKKIYIDVDMIDISHLTSDTLRFHKLDRRHKASLEQALKWTKVFLTPISEVALAALPVTSFITGTLLRYASRKILADHVGKYHDSIKRTF